MRRTSSRAVAAAAAGVVTFLASQTIPPAVADRPAPASIQVGVDPMAADVPKAIVGANGRWPAGELGAWHDDAPDAKMLGLAREIGLSAVRYPGGTVANLFDWKKAIGPQESRGCQVGGGFVGKAEPFDSTFGPDEQQRFVAAIGATTLMMTPNVVSTTRDAADFVEYMNAPVGTNPNGGPAWAQIRAENGHPAPYRITWWEVGNEPYNANQRYWRSADNDTALRQYTFGGTQRQVNQPVGTPCDHRAAAGVSDGSENQQFTVWYPPVRPDSQVIRVGGEAWTEVADLAAAGPDDPVYSIAPESGRIRFGDGSHGRIPPDGAAITADYDSGPHPGFVDYYAAMKAADPSIEVCTAWARPEFIDLMGHRPYDCLAPHLYTAPDVSGTPAQVHDELMPLSAQPSDELEALRAAGKPIEVGEYGAISRKDTRPAPEGWAGSLSWSLYLAGVINGMIAHDVTIASVSNLNEAQDTVGELFGGAPDFHRTARSYLLGMYSQLAGSRPVRTTVGANPVATGGGYDALQVLSTRTADDGVRMIVINRDRENDVTSLIHVDRVEGEQAIRATTLDGPDFTSYDTAADDTVVRTTTSIVRQSLPEFTYRFPAHSVTLLEISAHA
ncbi:MAG TPA: hypothetical protein VHC49_20655 [Mycobacteriales bacterium]|nr:hypothetical protein [Mycobacteriales bacterium]